MKILIAEDDKETSKVFKKLLDIVGNEVVLTSNGLECLKRYKHDLENSVEDPYDVVLVDFAMPKLDGINVINEIKRVNPNQKIVLITAYSNEILSKIPNRIDVPCLQKPISLDGLLTAIKLEVLTKS